MKNNIKAIREKSGMTQATLARIIGVTQQAVSLWENDSSQMPIARKLPELAKALGCTIDDLFYEGDDGEGKEAQIS